MNKRSIYRSGHVDVELITISSTDEPYEETTAHYTDVLAVKGRGLVIVRDEKIHALSEYDANPKIKFMPTVPFSVCCLRDAPFEFLVVRQLKRESGS